MAIDRRTFIVQGATLLATTPCVGVFVPGSSMAQSPRGISSETHDKSTRFKIDGWDTCDVDVADADDVWLRLNQSWRAAWR
jgi:hypothetical protein